MQGSVGSHDQVTVELTGDGPVTSVVTMCPIKDKSISIEPPIGMCRYEEPRALRRTEI